MPQRVVPTLTEVLEAPDWHVASPQKLAFDAVGDSLVEAEPQGVFDEEIMRAVTRIVDAAVDDFRAQLLPRVQAVVRQAMDARTSPLRGDD